MSSSTSSSERRRWHITLALLALAVFVLTRALINAVSPLHPPIRPAHTRLDAIGPATETLFVGTSHMAFGIDRRSWGPSGLKLAAGALDYVCMEPLVSRALARAPQLRTVVLEADIIALRGDTVARRNGDLRDLYALGLQVDDFPRSPYWRFKQRLTESAPLRHLFFQNRLTPEALLWYRQPARAVAGLDVPGDAEQLPTDVIKPANDGRVVVGFHRADLEQDRSDANRRALLALARRLQQRGLDVVLLRLPHHPSYAAHQPAEWEQQMADLRDTLARELDPRRYRYLDWFQDPTFPDAEFLDGHHLNAHGAARLTARLQAELARPR